MRKIKYIEDEKESTGLLFRLRLPSLIIGLIFGVIISFLTSNLEEVILKHVQIAFFLPFVVYMADAIGTQTQTVFARDLKIRKGKFRHYLMKETALGILFGLFFGAVSALVAMLWLGNNLLSLSVGISMFLAVATAPLVALITTQILYALHEDPAAWAGPIATVIQDMASVVIYGFISSAILLSSTANIQPTVTAQPTPSPVGVINSFEDCEAAGYPIMESYPRQCRTSDGKHFVENITISE